MKSREREADVTEVASTGLQRLQAGAALADFARGTLKNLLAGAEGTQRDMLVYLGLPISDPEDHGGMAPCCFQYHREDDLRPPAQPD